MQKMGEDSYDLEGGGDGEMAFNDKSVRRGFIKKVYAIISVQVWPIRKKRKFLYIIISSFQLLLTFGCVVAFNQSNEIKSVKKS